MLVSGITLPENTLQEREQVLGEREKGAMHGIGSKAVGIRSGTVNPDATFYVNTVCLLFSRHAAMIGDGFALSQGGLLSWDYRRLRL